MKKARYKYLLRSIKKNAVSFFAVALIAATSIAIFLGLQSTGTAMLQAANRYFVSNKLETLEVACAGGITQEDIEALSRLEDVDAAEGGYSTTVLMNSGTERILLQALSLCSEINEPVVLEGELPSASDEVAVEEIFAEEKGIQVGDEITLEHDGELAADTFVVTAVMNQPAYCCAVIDDARGTGEEGIGSASYYIVLAAEAFRPEYYGGCYTKAYIRNDALDEVYYYLSEYSEQEAALKEKVEDLGTILEKEWVVSTRNDIGDIRGLRITVDGLSDLSYAMSLIFLIESIIVCYSAVSRMIEDQRVLTGAQKAMGFTPSEILTHYMLYNVLCAVLGILVGFAAGVGIVENLMLYIFSLEFLIEKFEKFPLSFDWKSALGAAGICLAIFLAATWAACAKQVRRSATELLRGEMPARSRGFFFEKWKGYQKLSLYSRTMIKNILNDRSRMMTTIMGVVGCIALLVICFSLKMTMEESSVIQFERYFLYQNRLVIDSSAGSAEDFEAVLEEEGISYTVVQDKAKKFLCGWGRLGHCPCRHGFRFRGAGGLHGP